MLRDTVSMFLPHISDLFFHIPLFVEFRLQLAFLNGDMLVKVAKSSLEFLISSYKKGSEMGQFKQRTTYQLVLEG